MLGTGFDVVYGEVLAQAFDIGCDDVVNLELDELGDILAPQSILLTALLEMLLRYRIGISAADVDLSGIKAASFGATVESDVVKTHAPIATRRFRLGDQAKLPVP
ncbi:hypothetical protein WI38_01510 [Burkholderia ubonensis]|uniref:Uncharacterized protein n=1 Tax=Burkholderia ubonensis TaxID=101571 RepID=A0A117XHQ7_9BURK|nr:hypothetical protein [Burkholderia ubonensis]KUZ61797.1 hypothetical protein WI35_30245 [Burkholderia ubonensis]KUZ76202.1 hypothetical protein WI37_16530 [Burkholderia ubonensis]KUZ80742.1 hypothetical protein WI38_01510 [Burkholderia ubonensis]KUZ86143.1 hypothetical protein WI39_25650 [Burkholderia ubonensis]